MLPLILIFVADERIPKETLSPSQLAESLEAALFAIYSKRQETDELKVWKESETIT